VKALFAASVGLPIVANSIALGDLKRTLDIKAYSELDTMISRTVELLLNPKAARQDADSLFDKNSNRWKSGLNQRIVSEWLSA
jgi:hypothetical protein